VELRRVLKLKIKRNGLARLDPGTKYQYFNDNHNDWLKLKNGGIIDVPDELFELLNGVIKVEDYSQPERKKKGRRVENLEETISFEEEVK